VGTQGEGVPAATDRETLVALLAGAGVWLDRCPEIADTILASDWLADRDHESQAHGVREAAEAWPGLAAAGGNVYVWLRDRADRIEAGRG
jgi:hypothetical protein